MTCLSVHVLPENMQELCSSKDAAAANEEQLTSELSTVSIIFDSVWYYFVDAILMFGKYHEKYWFNSSKFEPLLFMYIMHGVDLQWKLGLMITISTELNEV